jgi:hypothetical protein
MKRNFWKIHNWLFGDSLIVYVACRMTGRDKAEMVHRARFVLETLAIFGIKGISPVVEEGVKDDHVKLINLNVDQVRGFWARDKYIIRNVSHAVLFDHAEMSSLGMTGEYCLNRGVLWKPTVILLEKGTPTSVSIFEDDFVAFSIHVAASMLSQRWSSRWKRWNWRMKMVIRSFPKWVGGQILAWR